MTTSRELTLTHLIDANACSKQRELFQDTFGDSVTVTEELCLKHADDFEWSWAAENLLTTPARAEYDKVTTPARAECDKVKGAAWAEYDKVTDSAWAEYDKVRTAAWAEYDKVKASAFARANISQMP